MQWGVEQALLICLCWLCRLQDSHNFKDIGKQVLQDFHGWVQVRVSLSCISLPTVAEVPVAASVVPLCAPSRV